MTAECCFGFLTTEFRAVHSPLAAWLHLTQQAMFQDPGATRQMCRFATLYQYINFIAIAAGGASWWKLQPPRQPAQDRNEQPPQAFVVTDVRHRRWTPLIPE